MTDWDNFVDFVATTDITGDIQGVEGPRFLKYFPFPENLPGKTTPPGFNFYGFKTVGELNKAIQSGQNVEPESMTAKLKYMIALAKMNISLKSDQDKMLRLYNQGLEKNNWVPFYEYYYSVKNEIDSQKKLLISLKQLFERRSSLTQTNYKEEKEQTFNPVWDEVRHRLKAGSKISTFMEQIKDIMLSPNKNPPPSLANVRTAINLCETADNAELINQYLSWQYIDFNEVPCGSLDAWSDYTSFRFENLLEKNDQSDRLLKTIQKDNSSKTALIRSLFIQPLSSLFESAGIDECVVDSPIERFNTLSSNTGVQWYASIKDNKPQGIRLTHFSNIKYYLHYCLVNMGNNDKAGFFGWLQVLYFLGCDVVYSLQDLASQVKDKLDIYLEEHEGEKSNIKPVLDYLGAIDARLDDFLEFWVNRMRTQYGLVAPAGLENDPSWEMGFHEFDMNVMSGGKRRKDSRRGNDRNNYNRDLKNKNKNRNKKVKVVGGIPCYIVCHQVEGTRLWPLEPLPEAIITTVKDTKSSFSGLYTTAPLSQFTSTLSAPIAASSVSSSAAASGTPVASTFDLKQAENNLTTIGSELNTLQKDANLGAIDGLITGNYATYKAMFAALKNIKGSLLFSVQRYIGKSIPNWLEPNVNEFTRLFGIIKSRYNGINYVAGTTTFADVQIDSTVVTDVKTLYGNTKVRTANPIAAMVGGDPTESKRQKKQGTLRDGRTTEKKELEKMERQEHFEREMAKRKEYLFTGISQEVSNKVDSIYWLSEFKNSPKFDPRRLDGISFKWWSGSTRTIENTPIYLGGAGVRIEGESSYDCAIPFVQLACFYMWEQKQSIMKMMNATMLSIYLSGSVPNTPNNNVLKSDISKAYQFLSAAYKEYIGIMRMLNQKSEVSQRSYILYNANLTAALHLQWNIILHIHLINNDPSFFASSNNADRLWNFIADVQSQFNSSTTDFGKISKISYKSFIDPIIQEISNVMNTTVGSSNSGATSSSTSVSSTVSTTGYKSKYDFKIISPANEATIVSDQYWNQLVSSLGGKKIWLPYTRDSGSSMSVDYVLDLLQIANDAQMLVRPGRGINFSAIMNSSAYTRRVANNSEFINTIKAGFVMVAMNSTGKTSPEAWRRTNATLLRKYIVNRMRQINQADTDTPRDVFTVQHLRMVIFEILTNNIAYTTLTNAAWSTRISKLKTQLVQECSGDMAGCPFITTREGVAKFMSSKGRALSGFDWQSGMMAFRARLTQTQRVVGEIQGNKTGVAKLLSS